MQLKRLFAPNVNSDKNEGEGVKSQSQIQGWGEQGSKTEHRMMALSFMSSGVCWLHRTDVIIRNYHLLHQEGSTERERKRGLILAIMSTRLLFAVIMGWGSFTRSDPPVFVSSKMFCVKGFFHSSLPKKKNNNKTIESKQNVLSQDQHIYQVHFS